MKKLSEKEMIELLEAGTERRDLEFKDAFSWDDKPESIWIKEHVIRAILAMSNTRLGGRIIIGITEKTENGIKKRDFVGVSPEQLRSFNDDDRIRGETDGFASSSTNFEIVYGEFESNPYIVITVQEFDEIPIICRKNGQTNGVLREGDIYGRSKRAQYGSKRITEVELREIIRMAVTKEKEELKAMQYVPVALNVQKAYDEQIEDLIK